jgi:DNA-binding phage protein
MTMATSQDTDLATEQQTVPHTIRLRRSALQKAMAVAGIELMSTLQRRAGLSRYGLDRVVRRGAAPGAKFIGSMLTALPGTTFEDLFELVPEEAVGCDEAASA